MTLPDERFRAVRYAREFLYDLLDPKKTPRIPRAIRKRAGMCLRHYPHEFEMVSVANEMQGIFDLDQEAKDILKKDGFFV